MHARGGFRHPPLNGLAVRQAHTEGHAVARLIRHHVQSTACHAHTTRAHLQAADIQAQLHGRIAAAQFAKHLGLRHAAILKHQLISLAPANHGNFAFNDEAGRALFHDEGRHAFLALAIAGARHEDDEIRARHIADPNLAAIDDPIIAILHSAGRHARRIATRTGFGNGHGGTRRAFSVRRQIPLPLHGIGDREHHVQIGAIGRDDEGHAGAAQFFLSSRERTQR